MSDGMSVISVSYCTCLVYTISDLRTFNFYHTKAIDCRSEYFVSFSGASNGMSVYVSGLWVRWLESSLWFVCEPVCVFV